MASLGTDDDIGDEHLFDGVRFFLVGFESEVASQYRLEMERRGGADAGPSGNGCTHVVVSNLFYDDPMCVAARAEGKKVVSEPWVEDSLDCGELADADRVIYWPVRHSKGIPGAQSLLICLTGYQKNYREYITKMVSLMGARFSKPLLANAVTHLICYKFEGEKYEVAKKVNIKLVNHRWLEDCLKAWEILPVDDYSKSTWDLELMDAQVNDSEHEAEAAGPRPLNNRSNVRCTPNSKNCEEAFVKPDVDAPKRSAITPSGNRQVVAGRSLNTPGHIMETEYADSKTHDITGQSSANSLIAVSDKSDVSAPIQSPPVHIMKTENKGSKTHDIIDQGSPNSNLLAVSAMDDILAPIQTSFSLSHKRDNSVVRNINSPLQEAEEKYIGVKTQDLASGILGPPSSREVTVFSNHHLNTLNGTPGILNSHKDNVSGKSSASHDQIDAAKVLLTSPSRGNQSVNDLDSSKVNRWQHQEKDGPSGIDVTGAGWLTTDGKVTNHESNPKSGDSKSNSIKNTRNSKKASRKPLLPEGRSVNHMASPKKAEESTPRANSNIYSLQMGHQKTFEHADVQSMNVNENIKTVDGLDGAHAQKRKSLVSPSSLNLQKEDLVSETGPLDSPFVSWLSDASDAEANAVSFGKQQSSLSTSRKTRSRKTSLKHGGPINGIKLPESSSSDKNVKSLPKARMSLKAMAENKCTSSPSPTVQDRRTRSSFSFQNKDGEDTHGSGNAVNQDCLHEIGSACTKDQAHDKSVRSSMASNSELEKVASDASVKEGKKRFKDTSSNAMGETSNSKKVATHVGRNTGAKRPRGASIEAEGSAINSGERVAPESWPAFPHEHADPASKSGCNSASAAELKTNPPKKAPICRVTDIVAKRTRNACAKIDDAQLASGLEFSKVNSQENIEINPKKFFDTENADEHQRTLPKKIPSTRVSNKAAKRSRKSDTNTSNETLFDKSETVAAGSLFDDLFPSGNVEECLKNLSSCASASDCGTLTPKTISNARIRNAVPKRKIKTVEDMSGSKCGKVGSAISSVAKAVSSKRTKEISCNINKVTADQDSEKSNKDVIRDVSGLFCQDFGTVDKQEGPHNSKLRSSKRNKVPTSYHEKENRLDSINLNSKSNRTASLCSKSDAKSIEKHTLVFSEHQRVKGSESGALILSEPSLFILSGDREQRREYRSILRRLKGRVCRDSHHWTYEATHFIAPDPLRRTEKFFAAAAAGRWILKREYLTSCIEAGKFVDEEPFEWFGTGLNDGETISFDAPKKWRNIRQQMGHGAFYGMQIVVYGQLILPTLDTVKRAVKAGDGTILATSPPYTRFLDSGVDFAVVSASIPRADAWVQEFIRHGIPCVSADYLVDYVCKPGHPLDGHVLFKTNNLANKSLEKLKKNQDEMATEEAEQSEDEDDPEDLSCSACGRKDRGEVMLICGDEDGETGCGIGMHIDCCDPPLDAVPDDDWLCPKCAVPKAKTKRTRGTERKARGSRRR
ncbi:BRCT domain-containing protein [Panicum miliaceum]|uniref:BRCT domain-containing protein n=1 Tax=Panicum miliaceum TaxID=4540 RepID=A0A3L6THL2_PANMI|nr:BRCT domain-containing protein [Panicum miliaceum]